MFEFYLLLKNNFLNILNFSGTVSDFNTFFMNYYNKILHSMAVNSMCELIIIRFATYKNALRNYANS